MDALGLRHRKVLTVTGGVERWLRRMLVFGIVHEVQEVTIRLGGSSLNRPLIALER